MKNIAILNFSTRNNGNCASIANEIESNCAKTNACIYQISQLIEPCGGCGYECLKPNENCYIGKKIHTLMERLINSECIYYVLPNICGFPCANYFIFNERTMGYFNGDRALMGRFMSIPKKFIIVSNTESDVFYKAMQQQAKEPKLLYMKTAKYKKNSLSGDILKSEAALMDLKLFLNS